ncbi:hypothetical protein T484DRAFT_1772127 [Baffinella frigidus]|nr:hypothetical protein T484DRAFT_1772127 [Cryptophyta sp. CCMP2293]
MDSNSTSYPFSRAQTFTGELSLALSSPVNDAVIFYTLDGGHSLYPNATCGWMVVKFHPWKNAVIFYTLDGSEPSPANHAGKGPSPVLVMLRDSAKVSAVAVTNDGQNFSQGSRGS